jgi:hypothetical protein
MDLKPFVKEAIKLLSRTLPENIEVTIEAGAKVASSTAIPPAFSRSS